MATPEGSYIGPRLTDVHAAMPHYTTLPIFTKEGRDRGRLFVFPEKFVTPQHITDLASLFAENEPSTIGIPLGDEEDFRASQGFIRKFSVGDQDLVIKRTRFRMSEIHMTRQEDLQDLRSYAIAINSPFHTLRRYLETAKRYREAVQSRNDTLPKELLAEELVGVFARSAGNYWMMYRYYEPVFYESLSRQEQKQYNNLKQQSQRQIEFLESELGIDWQDGYKNTIIYKNKEGDLMLRFIDYELLGTHTPFLMQPPVFSRRRDLPQNTDL